MTQAMTKLRRDRRGTVAIELALLLVPLLLFVFAIIASGQVVWTQNALQASVAEAARCASVNPTLCGTAGEIQAYAARQTGAGLSPSVFSVAKTDCGNQVSAAYPFSMPTPFVNFAVTLTAQACFPV